MELLKKSSIEWAFQFIAKHADGDLFPKVIEFDKIKNYYDYFFNEFKIKNISSIRPGACRRFIVPKDEISYRQATQLDPQDSIILSAIMYEYGNEIEKRRLSKKQVYSYRFSPKSDSGLYEDKGMWNRFWKDATKKASSYKTVLYCDISDFYNQIYHHVLENQLIESSFPNQIVKWILQLIKSTTANVSRGVPVGPHPIHLLAEASLIPIDNSLKSQGINFIRYADDIIVFCKNGEEAQINLYKIAATLDKQQRLTLQRNKTKIYSSIDFKKLSENMIIDRPINEKEEKIISLINKYSSGNPYQFISLEDIEKEDWENISESDIEEIIFAYLDSDNIDFSRLRWFYRRLSQVGHPGAVEVSIDNIDKLTPCFANICLYLGNVQLIDNKKWKKIGTKLLKIFKLPIVQSNEYFRLLIMSVFTKNAQINHFAKIVKLYDVADPSLRREIILSAKQNNAVDWLRERKEKYENMENWERSAFIFGISKLPSDEKKFFLKDKIYENLYLKVLSHWAKTNE